MYTLYKFHFLNGISEINQLFDDILIYIYQTLLSKATYSAFRLYIFLSVCVFPGNWTHNLLRC